MNIFYEPQEIICFISSEITVGIKLFGFVLMRLEYKIEIQANMFREY